MSPSVLDPALIEAYRTAEYRVDAGGADGPQGETDPAFVLTIERPSCELAAWHRRHAVECSALVTACNPAGQRLDDWHNRQACRALAAWIARAGLPWRPATGLDPARQWPAEPGFLIAGVQPEPARELGRQFGQNAIVWAAADAVPRLILLR